MTTSPLRILQYLVSFAAQLHQRGRLMSEARAHSERTGRTVRFAERAVGQADQREPGGVGELSASTETT